MKDYHSILGVQKGASQQEIKAAYRQAVLKHHPDRNQKSSQQFQDIREAYEVLSGKKKGETGSDIYSSIFWRLKINEYQLDPSVIQLKADQRVAKPGDEFDVTFVLTGIGKILYIKGLQAHFAIIKGPKIRSGLFREGKQINVKWFYTYTLRPKKKGYLTLGPCLAVVNGRKIRSSPYYIKVGNHVAANKSQKVNVRYYYYVVLMFFVIAIGSVLANHLIPDTRPDSPPMRKAQPLNEVFEEQGSNQSSSQGRLKTGSSPLDPYLDRIALEEGSGNMVRFINGPYNDAVVCLADAQTGKVVRNAYIESGDAYEMKDIEKGTYFLRLMKGKNWQADQQVLGQDIKGGFQDEVLYKEFKDGSYRFRMNQTDKQGNHQPAVYRIKLYSTSNGNMTGNDVEPDQMLKDS